MALCDDCFEDFVHPLVHAGMEKNEAFFSRYGRHAHWHWDDVRSTITFSDPRLPTVHVHCSIVGTIQGNQWQWSWANKNIPQTAKMGMDAVRNFGEANRFEKLTTPFLDADAYTGWEMTAIAEHVLEALGGYRFPTDDGYCYLAYRSIESTGPPTDGDLQGATSGIVNVASGVDLTTNTGEVWNSEL